MLRKVFLLLFFLLLDNLKEKKSLCIAYNSPGEIQAAFGLPTGP